MFQFTTYHYDDLGDLSDLIEVITNHGLSVIDKWFDTEFDETGLTIQGTREQFRTMFEQTSQDDWGTDIEEFMAELVPVA